MRPRDAAELIALAAIWGASFLFMRIAAPEFGPAALAWVRVAGACLLLLPLLAWQGQTHLLREWWKPIAVLGVFNSVVPFLLFNTAALAISAGLSSIFNATTPLFGAVIAALWWRERLDASRIAGLAIGFAGVVALAWDEAGVAPANDAPIGSALAIAACLVAALSYGFSATYAKKRLAGVAPMAVAGGSQLAAALMLAPLAALTWPASAPGAASWSAAAGLALLASGVAFILYFRLIAHIGSTNAMSVTFLIPAFAVLWGWWLLDETVSASMLAGCAAIFAGTALVTGMLSLPRLSSRRS